MDMINTTMKFIEASQAGTSPIAIGGELMSVQPVFRENGYGSTTYGIFGYKELSGGEMNPPTEFDLDARLAALCDKLRARY